MKKIGTLILAIGLVLGFSGCKTEPEELTEEVTLEKIEITAQPGKTEYLVGGELDTTGLEVTATYSDETTKDVTAEVTTTGYDKTKAGEQNVEVSYTEDEIKKSTSFTVTVKAVELTKIEIITQPTKKEYFVGAKELDTTGIVVTATYNNGTTGDVTKEVTASGFDSSTAKESQTITVTYGGKSATFDVKIIAVEVTKIEITTEPTKKDYYIDDTIDLTGMVVTASYNDGSSKALTSTEYKVSGFDSSFYVNDKEVTVTCNGKTATFKINVVFNWYETPKQLPAGTNGTYGTEGTYVYFGLWPQDVVPETDVAGLALDENVTTAIERGYFKYVKGSDGNYYVKCAENAREPGYKYKKDNSDVGQKETTSRWFKVMPIKWRVVDESYKDASGSSKGKLLVAENILTGNVPYYKDFDDNKRTIDGETVYPNNYMHSQIRAYLNGYKYTGYDISTRTDVEKSQWKGKGFLQTAFTSDAINKIITTKVDNSEDSTTNYDAYIAVIPKATDYACDPTEDKIFLLSEYEVTKYSKRTQEFNYGGKDNCRIRVTTDFAKANYAYQNHKDGHGGWWWLRSPSCYESSYVCIVEDDGFASSSNWIYFTTYGVVPALSISF